MPTNLRHIWRRESTDGSLEKAENIGELSFPPGTVPQFEYLHSLCYEFALCVMNSAFPPEATYEFGCGTWRPCCCIHCPCIHCVPRGCISSRWWRWAFLELGLSVGSCESTPAKESWSGGWAVFHGAAKSSDELSGIAWNEWPWETQLWLQDSFSLAGIDPPVLSNGQNGSFLPSVFFSQQECGLPDRG